MILYHSSTIEVKVPDLNYSREFLDFGRGFYLTTLREQAIKYADRFKLRELPVFLNVYEFPDKWDQLKALVFDRYDGEWLDFVAKCRNGEDHSVFDIVQGGIANDRIFKTIDLYFSGDMTKDEALRKLKMELPNNQICLRTSESISLLKFIRSEQL